MLPTPQFFMAEIFLTARGDGDEKEAAGEPPILSGAPAPLAFVAFPKKSSASTEYRDDCRSRGVGLNGIILVKSRRAIC